MTLKRLTTKSSIQALCLLAPLQSIAQSTPTEFAEMSLHELFSLSMYEAGQKNPMSAWSLSYQYKTAKFEGYLDGTQSLGFNEVLGPPTNKTFPVLPTTITQTAHIYTVGYQFTDHWQGRLSVPYIKQKTDHLSLVPGYSAFTIETDGIGDVVISASHNLHSESWLLSVGISLPSGSIDEEGDTPREPGNQQLPYTMQLGSGTYDIPIELTYQNKSAPNLSLSLAATVRTGTNDRNYRLGNNYSLTGRYDVNLFSKIEGYAGLTLQSSESIHGEDETLKVGDSPPIYPASICNPDLYGGKKIKARLGASWQVSDDYRISAEFGKPVYQDLNGPQPKEKWRAAFSIAKSY